jgi:hypothetical protein
VKQKYIALKNKFEDTLVSIFLLGFVFIVIPVWLGTTSDVGIGGVYLIGASIAVYIGLLVLLHWFLKDGLGLPLADRILLITLTVFYTIFRIDAHWHWNADYSYREEWQATRGMMIAAVVIWAICRWVNHAAERAQERARWEREIQQTREWQAKRDMLI